MVSLVLRPSGSPVPAGGQFYTPKEPDCLYLLLHSTGGISLFHGLYSTGLYTGGSVRRCTEKNMVPSVTRERDDDSGQFTKAATDSEVMDHVKETGGVATSELAEAFDVERPTAYRWLCDLEEESEVRRREVGGNLLWLPAE
jgi:hypothetical protein